MRKYYDHIHSQIANKNTVQSFALVVAAISVGLVAVGYAQVFRVVEKYMINFAQTHPLWIFVITPMSFVIAWYLVWRFAPSASGSGIPQVFASNELNNKNIEHKIVDELLSMKTALVKIVSSIFCLIGGGAIGREGPTIQISASIFHLVGCQFRKFYPSSNEKIWIVSGAATGLASAFNTPLGGIVYAIEELSSESFSRIKSALLIAVIVGGLVSQWLLGSYLYLGFPRLVPTTVSFVFYALLCGCVSGVLGTFFSKMLYSAIQNRGQIISFKKLLLLTLCCGVAMAALIKLDAKSMGSGSEVISSLLFKDEPAEFGFIFFRWLGTIFSYLCGAAGGIFSPSISIGASIGGYLASILNIENQNLMCLLGMIGFLTGVTKAPFTSFILVLEMTDRHSAIFPMMACALSALWCSNLIQRESFYDRVKIKYLPKSPST